MNMYEKELQTSVVFGEDVYDGDIKNNILNKLIRRFKNKCYMSMYINEIVELVAYSNIVFSIHDQECKSSCNVRFNVRGIKYNTYDIVFDLVVRKIDSLGNFICSNDHAAAYIKSTNILAKFKEGDTIFAKVGDKRYTPLQSSISISAYPFVSIKRDTVLYSINISDVDELLSELKKIEPVVQTPLNNHFSKIIHPYKEYTKGTPIKSLKSKIIISHPDTLNLSDEPSVIVHTDVNDIFDSKQIQEFDGLPVIEENLNSVMFVILERYRYHRHVLKKLNEMYKSKTDMSIHKNIWDVYQKNKLTK